jgi:ADP-ribose pyrophosphatase YjhB (NUDIX family)
MMNSEPEWLTWARELQAIAQNGLTFARDPYDRERYEALRALSVHILCSYTGASSERIGSLFDGETGYATPKIDVRAAVFDEEDRVLMVREISDGGRWTLPGGWADVNVTPAQSAVKEVLEESGYAVAVTKLASAWDRTRQGHPRGIFSCCKMFFICELRGGTATAGLETSAVGWFTEAELPTDLSLARVLPHQLKRMFDHRRHPDLAADFD